MSRKNQAFTLVELLVVIAIVGLLVGLLLPAVQAAREAARMMQCQNNLRQIGLATHSFHDAYHAFPPARYQPRPGAPAANACGGSETTWLVRIMPFLEQTALESKWDYAKSYADHPEDVRSQGLAVYCCPSRRSVGEAKGNGLISATTTTWIRTPCGCPFPVVTSGSTSVIGALGDYGGNLGDLSPGSVGLPTDLYYGGNGSGVIIASRAQCSNGAPVDWIDHIAMRDIVDGTSNTLLAGEMHVPVGKLRSSPEDAFIFNGDLAFSSTRIGGPTVPIASDPQSEGNSLVSWGSWHRGACNFVLSDGSVRSISNGIDTETLGNLCNRRDGQVVAAVE